MAQPARRAAPKLSGRSSASRTSTQMLFGAAFVAAFSGVAYELLLASYASFLLGATVFQYSLIVALMMASMGLGALVTHRNRLPIIPAFLGAELLLVVLASGALPLLYWFFAKGWPPHAPLFVLVLGMGGVIGMEIPLLNQLARSPKALSRILFYDYLGGFLGGLAFPLWLVPKLGLFRVSALLALLNAVVAIALLYQFRDRLKRGFLPWAIASGLCLALAAGALASAETLRRSMEKTFFDIRYR